MRSALLSAVVALLSGCWTNACVVEREPWAPDLCHDLRDTVWRDAPPEGTSDFSACYGDERFATTCDDEGFTVECDGAWHVRPGEPCP